MRQGIGIGLGVLLSGALAACQGEGEPAPEEKAGGGDAPVVSNRIEVPPDVRRNLGIRFVPVERREVDRTLRIPGRFEWTPGSRRHVHVGANGRVSLKVRQFQPVERGDLLATLDSPQWQEMQARLVEAATSVRLLQRQIEARARLADEQRSHKQAVEESLELTLQEVRRLQELDRTGGGRAAELAQALDRSGRSRADLAEVEEEIASTELAQAGDEERLETLRRQSPAFFAAARGEDPGPASSSDLLLGPAASITGLEVADLLETVDLDGRRLPRWHALRRIEVRATMDGLVQSLEVTDGDWVEPAQRLLVLADPSQVRFHADLFQADLGRVRDGLPARIVPPRGVSADPAERLEVQIQLGFESESHARVISVYATPDTVPAWARPGVAASLEIVLEGTSMPELALPKSALVRDGLEEYFFRRDPRDPDQVVRVAADLGLDDGYWVVVKSGLVDGDEVVLDGAYELALSGLGKAPVGGHFHADGSFHAEDH